MSNNNIEEDIKTVEENIDIHSLMFGNGNAELSEKVRNAIRNVVNELKEANNQLDLDYIKDNYIHKDKIKQFIKNKEIYLPMANTIVDEYTEAEVICREIKNLKELLNG